MSLKEHLKILNDLHRSLRQALTQADNEKHILHYFLALHSQLHSGQISPRGTWSYEDYLLEDLEETKYRLIPQNQEHSIAWIVWHLTRVEDVTMNLLVAGRDQVFETGSWQDKTCSPIKHTGNGTGLDVVEALSGVVDFNALRAYRMAVGLATQEIVHNLAAAEFHRKVAPENIQRIIDEGVVIPAGMNVVDYWQKKDVAGLLLMPPTRHTIVHWNEAERLKRLIS